MQVMILAAGFGTRLLPHTKIKPKPLFPVLNIPLLLLTIERLKRYGFDHIIVNCHHLKEQIVESVSELTSVVVQEEETILGTGGGLRKALSLCKNEPLMVTNGDIYHCVDLHLLYRGHQESGNKITMALHDYPRFNTVTTGKNSMVTGFDTPDAPGNLAFTGLQVIEPEMLEGILPDTFSCIIDHYRGLIDGGLDIHFERTDGAFWTDMGTVQDYLDLHGGLLKGDIPPWEEFGNIRDETAVHAEAAIGSEVEFTDWATIGAATVKNKVIVTRSVIWDGVNIESGAVVQDQLMSSSGVP